MIHSVNPLHPTPTLYRQPTLHPPPSTLTPHHDFLQSASQSCGTFELCFCVCACVCVCFTEMWYWVFLWCLFSSLLVHGAVGLLMCVMLQRHRRGRLITVVIVSVGFLASLTGSVITSAAVAGVYRVAGKDMAPLEALVFGVGQTTLTVLISFSRILATL
uniref:Transmembrane protein 170B n=1 Tax=Electrophorus electricus TaxID=8005 RepID=A0AAY5EII2_ELEEL